MKEEREREDVICFVIGRNLAEKRRRLGVTLEQLGACLGVSIDDLMEMEAGKRRPDATVLFALAQAFDVTPQYFFAMPPDMDMKSLASLKGAHDLAGDYDNFVRDGIVLNSAFARILSCNQRKIVIEFAEAIARIAADI